MWGYEKRLQYPIKITRPNAKAAQIILSQYGGPDGEMGASLRYLSQRYTMPCPQPVSYTHLFVPKHQTGQNDGGHGGGGDGAAVGPGSEFDKVERHSQSGQQGAFNQDKGFSAAIHDTFFLSFGRLCG